MGARCFELYDYYLRHAASPRLARLHWHRRRLALLRVPLPRRARRVEPHGAKLELSRDRHDPRELGRIGKASRNSVKTFKD